MQSKDEKASEGRLEGRTFSREVNETIDKDRLTDAKNSTQSQEQKVLERTFFLSFLNQRRLLYHHREA
jgi:hypothetical protein